MIGVKKVLRSNARKNSKAAFLASHPLKVGNMLPTRFPRRNTPEKLYEPKKNCDDDEDDEFPEISFDKFASERPRMRLPEC